MSTLQKQKTAITEIKGIKLSCQRCHYSWTYNGKNPYVCACPYCRTSVTVNKKMR
jgi:hypothetical protein